MQYYMNPENDVKQSPSQNGTGATLYGGGDLQMQKQSYLNVIAAVNKLAKNNEVVHIIIFT